MVFRVKSMGSIWCCLLVAGSVTLAQEAGEQEYGAGDNIGFQSTVESAVSEFNRKQYDRALELLQSVLPEAPNDAFIWNLIGAIKTKQQEYEGAREAFNKALNNDPGFFPARFNLGELYFLEKNYDQALTYFENLRNAYPGNELVEFKLVLIFLKLDDQERADRLIGRMRFPGETPAWYFAKAASLGTRGERREARKYLATARQLYRDNLELFEESLKESGLNP